MAVRNDEMQARVVKTLQDLIRINTTNPPGNETACARYIKDRLAAEGVDATILEPRPGRGSVIARLKGDGSQRPLLLLSHIDVVAVEAERWQYPPFGADIVDGFLWGRGTVDTKNLTALELEMFLEIKRQGLPLKRDIILAATADEEAGGTWGVGWLTENHFGLLDAEYAINEGGGIGMEMGSRWVFTVQTAEKGICWTRVRGHGDPGHASTPRGETAVGRLVAALDRLAHGQLPYHLVGTVEAYVRSLSALLPSPQKEGVLGLLSAETEEAGLASLPIKSLAPTLRASLHNTAVPTILRAGEKINVIPSLAEGEIDCRILPGQTPEGALAEMRALLGDDVEAEIMRGSPGVESGADTPFFHALENVTRDFVPGSVLLPSMVTGATDGRYLGWKGVKVYGYCPMMQVPGAPPIFELFHNHNERVAIEQLGFAGDVLWEVLRRTCL